MKIKTPPRKIRTVPAKVSLQPDTPVEPRRRQPPLQRRLVLRQAQAPCGMGGVLFFKLQRFFCGKAAGFPPPPLNAGLHGRSLALRRGVLPRRGLDAFAQRSSYTLIQFLQKRFSRSSRPRR